jgi:hypothetical protein
MEGLLSGDGIIISWGRGFVKGKRRPAGGGPDGLLNFKFL